MVQKTQPKKNQRILFSLFLIIGLISGLLVVFLINPELMNFKFGNKTGNDGEEAPAFTNLTLTVDFGNSSIKTLTNLTAYSPTSTVFDLLANHYSVGYDSYSNGKLVTSINGIANSVDENKFWFYWINEEYINVAASVYPLHSNDRILWNYTESIY